MDGDTYETMTVEHLGSGATDEDLAAFVAACEARQKQTGESDEEVTDWMWNNGDFGARVAQYIPDFT